MNRTRMISGALVSIGGLVAATTLATISGQGAQAAGPTYVDAGYLALATSNSGNGAVTWYGTDGTTVIGSPQTISGSSKNCSMDNATAAANLVSFAGVLGSGSSRPASYRNGSIGVAEKTSGTSCLRVDTGETLVLSVGARNNVGPVLARALYADLELKQDSAILATPRNADGSPVTKNGAPVYFALRSGKSIAAPPALPPGVSLAAPAFDCTGTSGNADSGPDSGPGDNCRWPISAPTWLSPDDGINFASLELLSLAGSFSFEGGGDGTADLAPAPPTTAAPLATVFELTQPVDGELDCFDSATTPDGDVTVRRLDNTAGACTPIPYTLSNDATSATFRKPLNDQPTAQFAITAEWSNTPGSPASGTAGPTYSPRTNTVLPVTRINYEAGNPDVYLGWCRNPVFAADGTLTGLAAAPTAADDQDSTLGGVQYSCVASQTSVVHGTTVDTVEQLYLYGDAVLRH